ncbi:AraC family transcriptional regulator [Nocardia australiensis]|uniref:AraC family transcriptional regulator n=1 Tax=Nocardia australiensis TaxID=2887191 RepID=UPI001D149493|nr:helix-turn-helix transcriptional regulator [Nocardia australiensis]
MSIIGHDPLASTSARVLQAGARIERHRHTEHQVVYPSSGVAEVRTDAGNWIAPADRAIWIPAGCWHEHRFYGPTRFHCVAFAVSSAPDWTTPLVVAARPLVRELIITCTAVEQLPDHEAVRLRQVLLDQLRRCPEQSLRLPVAGDQRLRNACALVESDLTIVWTLPELGRRVGAAERTLTRLFRVEFAMTYPQWRTQLRLHRAMQLLAEDLPVTVVAHHCGWATPSAFIDVYRRALGHTPGAYRADSI